MFTLNGPVKTSLLTLLILASFGSVLWFAGGRFESKLRNWSIKPIPVESEYARGFTSIGPGPGLTILLARPGDNRICAVAWIRDKHPQILNPANGYDYGPIPLRSQLTSAEADQLWAENLNERSQSPLYKKYRLIEVGRRNPNECVLDVVFSNCNHIEKYRFNWNHAEGHWVSMKETEGEDSPSE
jgi:hypothetical protein